MGNENETRQRIISATIELLNELPDVEKITVRLVAQRAEVGVGLINYHFHTRDNLISLAIGSIMAEMATAMGSAGTNGDDSGVERIRSMLKSLYTYAEQHEKFIQFLLTHGIINGDLDSALYLVPGLKEVFPQEKDEIQLRIIALQILLPIQVASINPSAFRHFTGIDLHDVKQRDAYIDTLVDNVLTTQK